MATFINVGTQADPRLLNLDNVTFVQPGNDDGVTVYFVGAGIDPRDGEIIADTLDLEMPMSEFMNRCNSPWRI